MAFKGLRFAGLEWKNITASKIMWVVIAAIAKMCIRDRLWGDNASAAAGLLRMVVDIGRIFLNRV